MKTNRYLMISWKHYSNNRLKFIAWHLIFILAVVGNARVCYCDDSADKEFSLGSLTLVHTFRELLLPLDNPIVCAQLNISQEQSAFYSKYREDYPVKLPYFGDATGTPEQMSRFFVSVQRALEGPDRHFERYYDEVLLPKQQDAIMGMYLVQNGLNAFYNAALQRRLELNSDQIEKLSQVIANRRQERRAMWGDFHEYVSIKRIPQQELLLAIDLRKSQSLNVADQFLSDKQKAIVLVLLKLAPPRSPERLTFGF